jgi:hypothetical protein
MIRYAHVGAVAAAVVYHVAVGPNLVAVDILKIDTECAWVEHHPRYAVRIDPRRVHEARRVKHEAVDLVESAGVTERDGGGVGSAEHDVQIVPATPRAGLLLSNEQAPVGATACMGFAILLLLFDFQKKRNTFITRPGRHVGSTTHNGRHVSYQLLRSQAATQR